MHTNPFMNNQKYNIFLLSNVQKNAFAFKKSDFMKFPSILKIPRHQRFQIKPRYYDPVKEDIEQRESWAKSDASNEIDRLDGRPIHRSRIAGSFVRSKPKADKSSMLRFLLMTIMFSGIVGYMYFGNVVLYIVIALFLGAYLYTKFRG